MKPIGKILIVVILVVAVGAVMYAKKSATSEKQETTPSVEPTAATAPASQPTSVLPTLVELGSDKCIPCKAMAYILDELRKEYDGKMKVVFIDVWKNPDRGSKYNIRLIPTQVFLDGSETELFRHEGFFAKDDILKKWKELGYDFDS